MCAEHGREWQINYQNFEKDSANMDIQHTDNQSL